MAVKYPEVLSYKDEQGNTIAYAFYTPREIKKVSWFQIYPKAIWRYVVKYMLKDIKAKIAGVRIIHTNKANVVTKLPKTYDEYF